MTRTLRVETNPPGAKVYVDGKSIGESPAEISFVHFGTREIIAEKDGYGRTVMMVPIEGSWYEGFPFDFFTDLLFPIPRTDLRTVAMKLRPTAKRLSQEADPAQETADAQALLQRAKTMRDWSPLDRRPAKP